MEKYVVMLGKAFAAAEINFPRFPSQSFQSSENGLEISY